MEDFGFVEDFFIFVEELLEMEDLLESDDDVLIIKLINVMLVEVIKEGVLDIYIEMFEKSLVICFCVDGILYEMLCFGCKLVLLLVLCIKVMVCLDIVEKCVL